MYCAPWKHANGWLCMYCIPLSLLRRKKARVSSCRSSRAVSKALMGREHLSQRFKWQTSSATLAFPNISTYSMITWSWSVSMLGIVLVGAFFARSAIFFTRWAIFIRDHVLLNMGMNYLGFSLSGKALFWERAIPYAWWISTEQSKCWVCDHMILLYMKITLPLTRFPHLTTTRCLTDQKSLYLE